MEIYLVGGAVRDELLGKPKKDRDWLVVGGSPEKMIERGFNPVGKDFPVFLHPETKEEYALARTETKIGPGYKGFEFHASPEVTLKQDLARRDFTINAIAKDKNGTLIDPYQGIADIQDKTIRHVSSAFVEDPLRIIRAARFASRLRFKIAPETNHLMKTMVKNREIDSLVPERLWQELSKGLMESHPSRMITTLSDCLALSAIFYEINSFNDIGQFPLKQKRRVLASIDYAASCGHPLHSRLAILICKMLPLDTDHVNSKARVEKFLHRLHVPRKCREFLLLIMENQKLIVEVIDMNPNRLLDFLESIDAFRREKRFQELLMTFKVISLFSENRLNHGPIDNLLNRVLSKAREISIENLQSKDFSNKQIKEVIRRKRLRAIERTINH